MQPRRRHHLQQAIICQHTSARIRVHMAARMIATAVDCNVRHVSSANIKSARASCYSYTKHFKYTCAGVRSCVCMCVCVCACGGTYGICKLFSFVAHRHRTLTTSATPARSADTHVRLKLLCGRPCCMQHTLGLFPMQCALFKVCIFVCISLCAV